MKTGKTPEEKPVEKAALQARGAERTGRQGGRSVLSLQLKQKCVGTLQGRQTSERRSCAQLGTGAKDMNFKVRPSPGCTFYTANRKTRVQITFGKLYSRAPLTNTNYRSIKWYIL